MGRITTLFSKIVATKDFNDISTAQPGYQDLHELTNINLVSIEHMALPSIRLAITRCQTSIFAMRTGQRTSQSESAV